ncbi:outer membrane protein [Salinarimonas rosea]|uniref:outer membrane protein n=1 Tax=Salinarimonas rosea TaxID=552063 RepID=UPI0003FBCC99|nr:outer membrane beta-barrel protein [Salinarimonas rosea]
MIRLEPALVAALAAVGGVIATSASAADLPTLPPAPVPVAVESFAGGWYLRGDIGLSSQRSDDPKNPLLDAAQPAAAVETLQSDFSSAGFVGAGVGYRFNSWFRADVTGEYRGRANYRGLDRVRWIGANGFNQTNELYFDKSEWVGLVNGYLDLGSWYGITPFVGAGIGFAHVTIDNFRDIGTIFPSNVSGFSNSVVYADKESRTNFAWALYAGLGYEVSPNLSLELGYRYLAMGDGGTGETYRFDGVSTVRDEWEIDAIRSHDLKLGMRWNLQAPARVHPAPLSRSF